MSEVAAISVSAKLGIHVEAADPRRRAALEHIVVASGHALAAAGTADVILSDGEHAVATGIPIVVLGAGDDDQAGLLPRNANAAQIDAALRATAAGLSVRLREPEGTFDALAERALPPLLTPRETEVLSAVADGLSNKEIARRLDISLHTVKFHIEALLRKLGARSRAEAVAKALVRRSSESLDL